MRLLVLTSRFPYPLEKGDKLRIYHQIRMLSKNHEIILCALNDKPVEEEDYHELKKYCTKIYVFPISKFSIGANLTKAMLTGKSFQVAYFYRDGIMTQIRTIVQKERPDHVYCQLIRMSEYARQLPIPKTLDYMDCFSVGMERRAEESPTWLKPFFKRESKKLTKYEGNIFSHFDAHSIISAQDRDLIKAKDNQQISIIPNGIDLDFFEPSPNYTPKYDLVFVGNMGYSPNVIAANYLGKSIMPLVWEKNADTNVLLAGARPAPKVKALTQDARIEVSGWIEDIRTAYQDGKIFVAPLFTGSGQQNKIIEAMALGIPCITTSLVNNAIGAKPNEEILIADSAEEFAGQILDLSTNPELQKKLSHNGREFVKNNISWKRSVELLESLWEE